MRTIDDKALDMLITQSLQKKHDIEQINARVLKAAKRHNRIQKAKNVTRLIAISFGAPIILAVMGYGAYRIVMMNNGAFSYIAAAIAIISAVTMTTYSLANFSFDEA